VWNENNYCASERKTVSKNFIPFALPCIGEEEINEVVDTLKSGWLTTGPKTKQFEAHFADFVGVSHALAVNSCTGGLHLALDAIGIQAGDKIITTPFTFTATAEVIRYFGADPVFVDIDPMTFNIDPAKIEQALQTTKNVKAIIPVHFAGQACDMDVILDLAQKYNVKVVEDAAHAIPTLYKDRMVGTLGDITVFSFYATKPIATGEGGMIVTNNPDYAKHIDKMRLHGISRDIFDRNVSKLPSWYYEVVAAGFKYNMSDMAAAIGLHQLAKAQQYRERRKNIATQYAHKFADLPVKLPELQFPCDCTHAWHLYVLQLELEKLTIDRKTFIEKMAEQGVGSSVHFIPLHLHPYWRDLYDLKPTDFPITLDVYQRAVSLPIYPCMSDEAVARVIQAVRHILTNYQK